MTIQELRIEIAALPDDMEVFVSGYEMGLIAPDVIKVRRVVERHQHWLDTCAPMLGTHAVIGDAQYNDGVPFSALCIERP